MPQPQLKTSVPPRWVLPELWAEHVIHLTHHRHFQSGAYCWRGFWNRGHLMDDQNRPQTHVHDCQGVTVLQTSVQSARVLTTRRAWVGSFSHSAPRTDCCIGEESTNPNLPRNGIGGGEHHVWKVLSLIDQFQYNWFLICISDMTECGFSE